MKRAICLVSFLVLLSGCTGYRMTSNIPPSSKAMAATDYPVTVTADDLDVPYEEIGPLEVVIRPPTLLNARPTQRHARLGLMQKAREIGATAVIKVTYEEQFDVVSFGHIKAQGMAVKIK